MKTYITDIIPRLSEYSKKLDNLTLLTDQHWVEFDPSNKSKIVYIFKRNNELLHSSDGTVIRGKWEILGNNSLIIDIENKSYLLRHGFFDENILALKIDNKDEFLLLINEFKINNKFNSLNSLSEFLNNKYLDTSNENGFSNYDKAWIVTAFTIGLFWLLYYLIEKHWFEK